MGWAGYTVFAMKIKAILFDMDGVLIDAKEWHYEALNRALNLFGMEISRYDHLVTYDGLPTKKKLEMLSLERGLPSALHTFIDTMKQQYTAEYVFTKCRPTFIHEFALSQLKDQGYLLGVCSNSIRQTVELMLKNAGIIHYFDLILSNQDIQSPKPNPEIYITAMDRLGVSSAETLILEDNENGIKAALASSAHLLQIGTVQDVYYDNITTKIKLIESSHV